MLSGKISNQMDSRIIKPQQCSLDRSQAVSIELNTNSKQGLALFRQTQVLRSTRHKNQHKQISEDFCIQLFNA